MAQFKLSVSPGLSEREPTQFHVTGIVEAGDGRLVQRATAAIRSTPFPVQFP